MGIIKKIFVFNILLLLFSSQMINAEGSFSNFVTQHFRLVKSFQADFKQIYYDHLRDSKTEVFGTLSYSQPGRMYWHYLKPDELDIYIGKDKIWIVDPVLENVTIQRIEKVTKINALSFLRDKKKLETHFLQTKTVRNLLDKGDKVEHLFLKPKEKSSNLSELQIGYQQGSFEIRQFVIIDEYQNYRKVIFSKIIKNKRVDLKDFEFQVPEDMEIIDGIDN